MKKKYKITKTKEFIEQEKKLPKEVKVELDKALKNIAENPTEAPHSMSLFGEPSPEELSRWMSGTSTDKIDLVFEYLNDKGCLNKKGKKLAQGFWEKYVKEKDIDVAKNVTEDKDV